MNAHDEERTKRLLNQSLPPMGNAEPARDLWPAMLQRIDARPTAPPWFDWALAGGLAILGVVLPASVPVFLYFL